MRLTLARSALMLLGPAIAASCAKAPRVETRAITMHAPASCAPVQSPYAQFFSYGDFEPTDAPPALPLATLADLNGIPGGTRELVVDVFDANDLEWRAHGAVPGAGAVDLLLLPYRSPCALSDTLDARADAALGVIDATHVIVAGGRAADGSVPTTALIDLAQGTVRALAAGLLVPRAKASATSWSRGAVVAGGERPDTGELLASAEVFVSAPSPEMGDFDGAPIALSEGRSHHGATTLATGETLLVGGRAASGGVLGSMEVVDPAAHRAHTTRLASLSVPRADPFVMRLASGEILVAGGVDAQGAPVRALEWLAPDAHAASRRSLDLVASARRAFVPLGAGGALAVIAPDTPTPGFQNVWVLSADGALQAATPIDGALTDVRLFAGADQAPVLWTGDRWLAWQPWAGAFAALGTTSGTPGPRPLATGDPIASPEPGLAAWIDVTLVRALRFGTRGPYATTPPTRPLLMNDTAFTAPDRLVVPGGAGAIRFDAAAGLTLDPGATVLVTDATFGPFTLDAQTPGATPPAIVLRDEAGAETVLDALSCPLAPGAAIHVERDADRVRASVDGAPLVDCAASPAAGARVAIGVRGASGSRASVVRGLAITRR